MISLSANEFDDEFCVGSIRNDSGICQAMTMLFRSSAPAPGYPILTALNAL